MALEPRTPTLDDGRNPELVDMTRRFRLAVRLTVLVVIAAMGDMIPGVPLAYIAPPRFWVWFQLVLSTPVVLWCGGRSSCAPGSRSCGAASTCSR